LNGSTALSYVRNTVTIGPSGAAWPFVPHKQTGTFFFEYCPTSHTVAWSSGNSQEVLGLSEAAGASHGAIFLAHVHPSDRFRIESLLEGALRGEFPYVATYRWIRPDNSEIRHLHVRALLEPDGSVFRGMALDISSEVVGIRTDPDLTATTGDPFNMLGIDGVVLDLEFKLRGIFAHHHDLSLTFGLSDARTDCMQIGQSLPECFLSTSSQEYVHRVLEQALELCGQELTVEWPNFRAAVRALLRDGVPSGIAISLFDVAYEQELARENKALILRLNQLTASQEHSSELANLSQEIVGYAALIRRYATGNPMLHDTVDALISATRALGERTRKLVTLHATTADDNLPADADSPTTKSSEDTLRITESARILFASVTGASKSSLPALLSQEGLSTIACHLDEYEVRSHLVSNEFVRILIVDVPSRDFRTSSLIRTLKRFFPALHIVCLVPGAATGFSDLQRAGALLVLPKPVTSHELHRVLKGLLEISRAEGA
jgi:hypothetical protein